MGAKEDERARVLVVTLLGGVLYAIKSKAGPAGTLAPYQPAQALDEAETFVAEVERRYGAISLD